LPDGENRHSLTYHLGDEKCTEMSTELIQDPNPCHFCRKFYFMHTTSYVYWVSDFNYIWNCHAKVYTGIWKYTCVFSTYCLPEGKMLRTCRTDLGV